MTNLVHWNFVTADLFVSMATRCKYLKFQTIKFVNVFVTSDHVS